MSILDNHRRPRDLSSRSTKFVSRGIKFIRSITQNKFFAYESLYFYDPINRNTASSICFNSYPIDSKHQTNSLWFYEHVHSIDTVRNFHFFYVKGILMSDTSKCSFPALKKGRYQSWSFSYQNLTICTYPLDRYHNSFYKRNSWMDQLLLLPTFSKGFILAREDDATELQNSKTFKKNATTRVTFYTSEDELSDLSLEDAFFGCSEALIKVRIDEQVNLLKHPELYYTYNTEFIGAHPSICTEHIIDCATGFLTGSSIKPFNIDSITIACLHFRTKCSTLLANDTTLYVSAFCSFIDYFISRTFLYSYYSCIYLVFSDLQSDLIDLTYAELFDFLYRESIISTQERDSVSPKLQLIRVLQSILVGENTDLYEDVLQYYQSPDTFEYLVFTCLFESDIDVFFLYVTQFLDNINYSIMRFIKPDSIERNATELSSIDNFSFLTTEIYTDKNLSFRPNKCRSNTLFGAALDKLDSLQFSISNSHLFKKHIAYVIAKVICRLRKTNSIIMYSARWDFNTRSDRFMLLNKLFNSFIYTNVTSEIVQTLYKSTICETLQRRFSSGPLYKVDRADLNISKRQTASHYRNSISTTKQTTNSAFSSVFSMNCLGAARTVFCTAITSFASFYEYKRHARNMIELGKKIIFRALSGIGSYVFRWNRTEHEKPSYSSGRIKHRLKKSYYLSHLSPFKKFLPHKVFWQGIAVEYNKIWISHKYLSNKKKVRYKVNDRFDQEPLSLNFLNTRISTILFKRTRRNVFLIYSYFFKNRPDLNRIIYYQTTGCLQFKKKLKIISKATDELTSNFLSKFEYLCKDYSIPFLNVIINGSMRNFHKFWTRLLGTLKRSVYLFKKAKKTFVEKETRKRMNAALETYFPATPTPDAKGHSFQVNNKKKTDFSQELLNLISPSDLESTETTKTKPHSPKPKLTLFKKPFKHVVPTTQVRYYTKHVSSELTYCPFSRSYGYDVCRSMTSNGLDKTIYPFNAFRSKKNHFLYSVPDVRCTRYSDSKRYSVNRLRLANKSFKLYKRRGFLKYTMKQIKKSIGQRFSTKVSNSFYSSSFSKKGTRFENRSNTHSTKQSIWGRFSPDGQVILDPVNTDEASASSKKNYDFLPKGMYLPSSVLKYKWAPRFLFFIDKTSYPFNGCRRSRHYHVW